MIDAVAMLIYDCEHLLAILEGKAEEAWNYEYQRQRIASARDVLEQLELVDLLQQLKDKS